MKIGRSKAKYVCSYEEGARTNFDLNKGREIFIDKVDRIHCLYVVNRMN